LITQVKCLSCIERADLAMSVQVAKKKSSTG